jgi:ATP-dependent RNA helicase DDX23/PRP28
VLERDAEELSQRERNQGSNRYGKGSGGRCQYTSSLLFSFYNLPSFVPDEDRYAHPERDRGDRHSRRDRDGRRGRHPPPSPQQQEERPPREGYQNVPTGPRAARSKGSVNSSSSSMPPPPVPASVSNILPEPSTPFVPPMTDDDLTAIRSRYLGVDKKKRKIRKMNDRKFVFDWDAQDDTFSEDSPVAAGSNRQGAQVMFGRGRLAGMDDGGGSGTRKVSADPHLADSLERRRAAKSGLDERHWTEKPLEEMKDRDWRIFREDFSISARGWFFFLEFIIQCLCESVVGGQIPHPLRSWTESSIPTAILECIEKIGYKEPSPIQRQAIPIGLQNRDIIGIAETGVHPGVTFFCCS